MLKKQKILLVIIALIISLSGINSSYAMLSTQEPPTKEEIEKQELLRDTAIALFGKPPKGLELTDDEIKAAELFVKLEAPENNELFQQLASLKDYDWSVGAMPAWERSLEREIEKKKKEKKGDMHKQDFFDHLGVTFCKPSESLLKSIEVKYYANGNKPKGIAVIIDGEAYFYTPTISHKDCMQLTAKMCKQKSREDVRRILSYLCNLYIRRPNVYSLNVAIAALRKIYTQSAGNDFEPELTSNVTICYLCNALRVIGRPQFLAVVQILNSCDIKLYLYQSKHDKLATRVEVSDIH